MKTGLTVIIPCYNEEGHLINSYTKLVKELERLNLSYEIIFVEDCSTDSTKNILQNSLKKGRLNKFIFHQQNIGRGGSVMDGIYQAKYNYVGFLDIDLEVSEKYIDAFLEKLHAGSDVVIGRRKYYFTLRSLPRILASKVYVNLVKLLLGLPFDDTEAGYKFFQKDKILPILEEIKDKKWFWDTEIVALSYYHGLKISEVPVLFKRRLDKKSTVKLFHDSIEYLERIILFKKNRVLSSSFMQLINYYRHSPAGIFYLLFKLFFFPLNEMEKILPSKGLVIDLGCGEGLLSNILSIRSSERRIIGVDLNRKRLTMAEKTLDKRENIKFLRADVLTYQIPSCTAIVVSDFLHHLPFDDQVSLLSKCYSALKSEGLLLIKEVDKDSGIRHMSSRIFDDILYPSQERGNFRSSREWITLLKNIGFTANFKETARLSPFSTVLITALKNKKML